MSSFIKGLKVLTRYTQEKDASGKMVNVQKVKSGYGLAPQLGASSQTHRFEWEKTPGNKVTVTVEQFFLQSMLASPSIDGC